MTKMSELCLECRRKTDVISRARTHFFVIYAVKVVCARGKVNADTFFPAFIRLIGCFTPIKPSRLD